MYEYWIKFISSMIYFYDSRKRKNFRREHSHRQNKIRRYRKAGIIGEQTYFAEDVDIVDKRTRIGKFCSIGSGVSIGTTRHPVKFLTTHPVSYLRNIGFMEVAPENRGEFEITSPVTIGNDVWIGKNAVIMDGLTIGDGAVIGSGAVVTHDVPQYAIAGGVPARVLKYRFEEQIIRRLLETRWWDRTPEVIRSLPMYDVEKCLSILENQNRTVETDS